MQASAMAGDSDHCGDEVISSSETVKENMGTDDSKRQTPVIDVTVPEEAFKAHMNVVEE